MCGLLKTANHKASVLKGTFPVTLHIKQPLNRGIDTNSSYISICGKILTFSRVGLVVETHAGKMN